MLEGTPLKVGERAVRDDEVLVEIKKTGKYVSPFRFPYAITDESQGICGSDVCLESVPCALGP